MARARRPPASRGVFSFEDPSLLVPREVVLDTSFVVEGLIASQPHHAACQAQLRRLAESRATVVFNRLLEMELYESAFGIALKEVYGRQWKERRQDGRVRRRARRVLSDVMMGWEGVLSALDWIRIELDEVAERIPSIMTDYGLSSYDAVHAATAFYVGTADFVTRDSKFALIPSRLLNLYVDSRHLRPCRDIRAR